MVYSLKFILIVYIYIYIKKKGQINKKYHNLFIRKNNAIIFIII